MDKLQQLSVFRRVVETGNITRAARDLAMSQPSVSRIIGELEGRLGVPLLLRSPRGLTTTEAGQAFHAEAVSILDRLEEAEASLRGAQASLAGPVRFACVAAFFNAVVLPWLTDFLRAHPAVALDVRLDPKQVDMIGEGIDLAIRFGPIREQSLIRCARGRAGIAPVITGGLTSGGRMCQVTCTGRRLRSPRPLPPLLRPGITPPKPAGVPDTLLLRPLSPDRPPPCGRFRRTARRAWG